MLKLKVSQKHIYRATIAVYALKGINLQFKKKRIRIYFGSFGCGKTTLLNINRGLDRITEGRFGN